MIKNISLAVLVAFFALAASAGAAPLPRPAHVVIVIDENRTLKEVIGSGHAPYLTMVAQNGALFTHAYGVTHPSQPNYFALLAGVTNSNGNKCPARGIPADAPNLASELLAAHLTFAAYSESLPSVGFLGCSAGQYAKKHASWTFFSNIPQQLHLPLTQLKSWDALPTVTIIVPNLDDDMHDGTVKEGDDWAELHLASLLKWAAAHDTLVVFTWDEGYDSVNSVPTMFFGPMIRAGRYPEHVDHYRVLRTIEDLYGLPPSGNAAHVAPLADIWK